MDRLSGYRPLPVLAASLCFAEFCLEEGEEEEEEEEEGDDAVLSLLQFESRHSLALSRPGSFLQPKSGRRMLSMKKLVVLWACCAAWWGSRTAGDGRFGDSDMLSSSVESRPPGSFCSSITGDGPNPAGRTPLVAALSGPGAASRAEQTRASG